MELGIVYRFAQDTTPATTATFAQYANEVGCSLSIGSSSIAIADKDQGDWENSIKGRLNGSLSLTINENLAPTGTDLNLTDATTLMLTTNSEALYGGVRRFQIETAKSGGTVITFSGFFESVDVNFQDQDLINYTISLKIVGAVTFTPVA
jgi:predicted secreted protein